MESPWSLVQTLSSPSMPSENDKDDSTKELTSHKSSSSWNNSHEGSNRSIEYSDSPQQTDYRSLMERKKSMAESIKSTKSRAVLIVPDGTTDKDDESGVTNTLGLECSTSQLAEHQKEKEKFYGWGDFSDDYSCSVNDSSQAKSVALHKDFPDKRRGDESVSLESTTNNFNVARMPLVDEFDPRRPWCKRPIEISIEEMKPLSGGGSDGEKHILSETSKADSRKLLHFDAPNSESEKVSMIASSISNSDITELDLARQALSTIQPLMNSFQRGTHDFHRLTSTLHTDQLTFNESHIFQTNPHHLTRRREEPFFQVHRQKQMQTLLYGKTMTLY